MTADQSYSKPLLIVGLVLTVLGAGLRLFQITRPDFIFYDEGMYLNYNRPFLELLSRNWPQNAGD